MEIKIIKFVGDNGWENETIYNATPSSELHIPRIGETVENKYGNRFTVDNIIWDLSYNSITVECSLIP